MVGLIEDVRQATYARAAHQDFDAGSVPPVLLALDEVANVAPLPGLPSVISEGGGQGLITIACLQDLSQARHRWPGQADGFPSLFGTTVVLLPRLGLTAAGWAYLAAQALSAAAAAPFALRRMRQYLRGGELAGTR